MSLSVRGALVVPTLIFGIHLTISAAAGALLFVGLRAFSLTAGSTAATACAGLAAVALGASAGALLGGLRAERSSYPVAGLALLQACFALASVAAPVLFRGARAAYLVLWPLLGGTGVGSWGLRVILALALLALPACIYASTPPFLARLISGRPEGSGLGLSFAFGLTFSGLAMGAGLAAWLLLPAFGTKGSFLIAVALSGLAAAGTVLARQAGLEGAGSVGRALSGHDAPALSDPASGRATADDTAPGGDVMTGGFMAAAVALFGFTAWAYLVVWDRVLGLIAGATLQAGAAVLVVLLLGLALGTFAVAGIADRRPRPIALLTVLLVASSAAAYGSMFLVPAASLLYLRLTPLLARPGLAQAPALLTAATLMLPACILLGAALPLLPIVVQGKGRARAGALAFLGLGALAADAATGLLFVPAFGLRRTLCLAAAIGLLSAVLFVSVARFGRPAVRNTIALSLLGMMLVIGGFPASWDPRLVASGLYRYGARSLERYGNTEEYLSVRRGIEVAFYKEGRDASVVVERTVQRSPGLGVNETLSLTVDGKVEATSGQDIRTQVLQGHIPVLLHGPTNSVLLVDFLNGVTAGSILRHPVKSLRVIEREPVLFEAAVRFSDYNHRPFDDERMVRIVDGARARLLADSATYDVIILSSLEPWLPHNASLLTSEGYALVRSRLSQGGLVAQRIQLAATGEGSLRAILRTFARAFESVLVFQLSREDLLLVGSAEPLAIDVGWLRNVIGSSPGVADDLKRVLVFGPNEVLLTFRLGGEALRGLAGPGPLNDDDTSPVEFASAAQLTVHQNGTLLAEIDAAWAGLVPFLKNFGALPQERADFLYNLAKSYLGFAADPVRARDLAGELDGLGRPGMARWVRGEVNLQMAKVDGALEEWKAVLDLDPGSLDALFSLGTYYLDNHEYARAQPYLAKAARLFPDTAAVRYDLGRDLYYMGRYREATAELEAARRIARSSESYPLVDYLVGISEQKLGRPKEAAVSLESYLKWAYTQDTLTRLEVDAHYKLADVYQQQGKRFEAMRERRKGEELLRRIQATSPAAPPGRP
jgi:tetratricopeptide (TPR) repeat protein